MTPVVPLEWHLCWLQSLSVKNIISPFSILLSATEGLARNRHASHKKLWSQLSSLLGVDGTWLRQKLVISVLMKTGPAAKLLSWQQPYRCHFVSFMILSGAKCEENCSNISRDILDSVIYHFSCTVYCHITLLICIIQKR